MQDILSTEMNTSRRVALLTGLGAGALVALGSGLDTAQAATAGKPFYDAITDVGCVPDARIETFTRDNRTWNHGDKRRIAFGTDNTEKINKFLEKISKEGGGVIVFPAGNYLVSGIVLQPGTGIRGASMHSTRLILADNSNRSVVTNRLADSSQGNAFGVSVEDLTIDGNRWGQWGLNWSEKPSYELSEPHIKQSHGVLLHRLPTNKDKSIDSYSLIQNVHVEFTWGSAFNTREHGGEVRIVNYNCYSL